MAKEQKTKKKKWFRKPAFLVSEKESEELHGKDLLELRKNDKFWMKTNGAFLAAGTVALGGVVAAKCDGANIAPPTPISPDQLNPPPASAPADFETGRPDVDMSKIHNASDNGPKVEVAGSDGMSGATKTAGKPRGATGSNEGFIPVNVPLNAKPAKQETPAEKEAREAAEKAYQDKINSDDNIIIKRNMEDILKGKMMAEAFVDTKVPLEASEFAKIPRETAVEIMQRVHSQTEEAAWIAFKLNKPFGSVSKAEQKQYWNSLSKDEQNQLRQDMMNPPDEVGAMIGRNARMARQNAFNEWLANNGFPVANGAGIGR